MDMYQKQRKVLQTNAIIHRPSSLHASLVFDRHAQCLDRCYPQGAQHRVPRSQNSELWKTVSGFTKVVAVLTVYFAGEKPSGFDDDSRVAAGALRRRRVNGFRTLTPGTTVRA